MERYEKVYVAVRLRVDTEGRIFPLAIEWEDGKSFTVQKVISSKTCPPQNVGACLTKRYDVLIDGREKKIYLETMTNRWFVEKCVRYYTAT